MSEQRTYNEDELVVYLQSQDQHAFSFLYDKYSGGLYGYVIRMTGEAQLSQDILQMAFMRMWNNFHLYDKTKGRLFTWMLNICRNITIDTFRSKAYKKQKKIAGDHISVSNHEDTSWTTTRFDSLGMRKHLLNLTPAHKLIIELAYFNGYTQKEISKEIGIPLGTVKTRMRSAILKLKGAIQ